MIQAKAVLLTPGATANSQGKVLESTIIPTFEHRGFEVVAYSKWIKATQAFGEELLLKHVPYTTIYGHPGYTEFLVKSQRYGLNTRIECKWQQSSGSVDEKFPYLYLNCIEAMPENDIIIVAGGGGMKEGAIPWLKRAVSEKLYVSESMPQKKIQVLSLDEFLRWANRTLK
jgi:hypothetical protein